MEQVSMYMAALPCPPLPLMVKQEISTEEDRECYKNSHDLIALLLLGAMTQSNEALNQQRKEKQLQMTQTLLAKLHAAKDNVDKAYEACSEFTAGYVCAFMNLNVSVTFMPLSHVTSKDNVHKACCSWHKAQEMILAGGSSAGKARVDAILHTDYSHLSYADMLGLHCKRFAGNKTQAGGALEGAAT